MLGGALSRLRIGTGHLRWNKQIVKHFRAKSKMKTKESVMEAFVQNRDEKFRLR